MKQQADPVSGFDGPEEPEEQIKTKQVYPTFPGIKRHRGRIMLHFVVTCAICEKFSIEQHDSLIGMEKNLVNEKSKWRLSRENGWVHKSCCKFISPLK